MSAHAELVEQRAERVEARQVADLLRELLWRVQRIEQKLGLEDGGTVYRRVRPNGEGNVRRTAVGKVEQE